MGTPLTLKELLKRRHEVIRSRAGEDIRDRTLMVLDPHFIELEDSEPLLHSPYPEFSGWDDDD